ncbi:uncharacterized protein LOC108053282 [Drosophila rhopaloa]|uniref:Chitin-binding type-2 domain-containing protein n=1 Tax=Drosophila rhopaloa TaxID=1041015 RepID=A0ABM5J4R2_DRORH|nr:uncharacterized protein LOC108053282 [Drosophila rhopaloa]
MLRLLIFLGIGVLGCQAACNSCSTHKKSCASPTEFQFCSANFVPKGKLYSCPKGYYCTGNSPVCSTNATLASCTGSEDNVTEYCRSIRWLGRFPYGDDTNISIKQYIYCFISGGLFYGKVYSCPGSTYFDSNSNTCATQTGTNSYLSLND